MNQRPKGKIPTPSLGPGSATKNHPPTAHHGVSPVIDGGVSVSRWRWQERHLH
ncbi:hypothetical protein ES332_D05G171300v1 [Gossypium tomentosum]|uniref:Uncharacterized protein n=1 Tax=Gossypium tomentosum TaxID=34277 RepID=A0A5D2KVX9_GOSTO|nr:hypothetical protein ES332_D05G171300v1 [Gossypium tomentosum]